MSKARYRMALVRLRQRIADGIPLVYEDSTTIGDKYTICSWGLCSVDPEQWPDAGDHMFPVDFIDDGRISVNRGYQQPCPIQRNAEDRGAVGWGCFSECRIFLRGPMPTREEALAFYDRRIAAIGELPEVCACNGTGELHDPVGGDKTLPCPSCRREDYEAWRPFYDPWGKK